MKVRSFAWLSVLLLTACGATSRRPEGGTNGAEGGATGAPAAAGGAGAACDPPKPALIRLAFAEQVASLRLLLGDELGESAAAVAELQERQAAFPALASVDEGPYIDDLRLDMSARLAQLAGAYVREHFADVTGCDADFACVRDFVATFAEQAFRRPLTDDELAALWLMVERAEALGVAPQFGAEYAVQAIFHSPHYLYRTEFGPSDVGTEALLDDHELASAVSYFLAGGPPDATLLATAAAGELATESGLSSELDRLLGQPDVQLRLERALGHSLNFDWLPTLVFDPVVYPQWSPDLARAMRSELDRLLGQIVAGGPAAAMLTSRRAYINPALSEIYGMSLPTGVAPDAQGFFEVELTEQRAGLFTRAGWLAVTSRPDGPDLLARGMAVSALLDCSHRPFEQHPAGGPTEGSRAARARARLADGACSACHVGIDPFGLALDEFDGLGRLRTHDNEGYAIDASVTLPELAGGAEVSGGAELSHAIPPAVFSSCLAKRVFDAALSLSLSDRVEPTDTCWQAALTAPPDASLADIVKLALRRRTFGTEP